MTASFAFIGMPQGMEWVVILVIAIVILAKPLAEYGRFLGKQIARLLKSFQASEDECP